ncbi:RNA-binding protein [Bartonella sp. HY329]|uniref:RNA-binding protein n=1 Tax=unclassified Bartonella TaxID=2645622 RepID=UPI0021C74B88|nr:MULTISPECIES: RNA-binding protein [unclassified Bartonella]UXM94691.1 RNA-binding protein [Bartonella sp. HY329]UXN09014.1 RNA-binding protein [Bartonella sp. HY328]
MNDRTCIVTRESGSNANMIRFVSGLNGIVVPDIKGNLPGRGAWVLASRATLEEAMRRKAFSRAFKKDVVVEETLADLVDELLKKAVLGSFAVSRRGGCIVSGAMKVDSAIRSGNATLILHAQDAAEDGKRKIAQAIFAAERQGLGAVPVVDILSGDEMSLAFGGNNVMHAAVLKGMAAKGFMEKVRKLLLYRGDSLMNWDDKTADVAKEAETE